MIFTCLFSEKEFSQLSPGEIGKNVGEFLYFLQQNQQYQNIEVPMQNQPNRVFSRAQMVSTLELMQESWSAYNQPNTLLTCEDFLNAGVLFYQRLEALLPDSGNPEFCLSYDIENSSLQDITTSFDNNHVPSIGIGRQRISLHNHNHFNNAKKTMSPFSNRDIVSALYEKDTAAAWIYMHDGQLMGMSFPESSIPLIDENKIEDFLDELELGTHSIASRLVKQEKFLTAIRPDLLDLSRHSYTIDPYLKMVCLEQMGLTVGSKGINNTLAAFREHLREPAQTLLATMQAKHPEEYQALAKYFQSSDDFQTAYISTRGQGFSR